MKRTVISCIALTSILLLSVACTTKKDDVSTTSSEVEVTRIEAPIETTEPVEETTAESTTEDTTTMVELTETALIVDAPETTQHIMDVAPPSSSTPCYIITAEEREMLARLVTLEAGICSLECKKAIASVVFNRLDDSRWGKTLYEVVYYTNAFSPAYLIPYTTAHPDAYVAVDYVVECGPTLPTQVRYFRASYDFDWPNYKHYKEIDNVYFGYLEGWEKGAW